MTSAANLDLTLKLRLRQLLVEQGYWCPIEVDLTTYYSLGPRLVRDQLTDLDVLGVRYDPAFAVHHVVGDCKSGKNVSDVGRVFWLRGVMDYFGADNGYYLRPSIDRHARGIAPRLKIRALNEHELQQVERSLNLGSTNKIPWSDPAVHEQVFSKWGFPGIAGSKPTEDELTLKRLYSYMSYLYWYIEPHRRMFVLVDRFQACAQMLDPANPRHSLLVQLGIERLAHCLMEIARNTQIIGGLDLVVSAKSFLYGGTLAIRERSRLVELINKVSGTSEDLDPPWLPELLELLNRFVRNPFGAYDVLRHLMAINLWCLQLNNPTLPNLGPAENTSAIVLAKDVAFIFTKITGIREAFVDRMKTL